MNTKEKEEYLKKKGWRPISDGGEEPKPVIIGWIKVPDMQIYSTDLAYEKERQ